MNDSLERGVQSDDWEDGEPEPPFKVLTRDEVLALREKSPLISPWRILAVQAAVGVCCAMVFWAVVQRQSALWSALYGMAVVVIPGAVLARGMARRAPNPAAAAAGFLLWELIKIVLAVAMLVVVAAKVPHLHWPALLGTMVVSMKMGWVALLWRRPGVLTKNQRQRD